MVVFWQDPPQRQRNKVASNEQGKLMRKCYYLILMTFLMGLTPASAATVASEQIANTEYPTETLYKIWQSQQQDKNAALQFYQRLDAKHLVESDALLPRRLNF